MDSFSFQNQGDRDDRREVIVKIDGSVDPQQQRGGGGPAAEDPPSQLIGQYLDQQRVSGGKVTLDMDVDMNELRRQENTTSDQPKHPFGGAAMRVSFAPTTGIERKSDASDEESVGPSSGGDAAEILKCSSSAYQRRASMCRMKTKSRLADTFPEELEPKPEKIPKSGILKSGQFKSGLMGRNPDGEDDDDPLLDEDFPEEYTKSRFDCMSLLQWVSLILLIAALSCTLSIPSLKKKSIWNLQLWKWEVLVLALICGRLLSGWVVKVIVFLIVRNFQLRKRVLYFVYGLKRDVQNFLWLALVLIVWQLLFDKEAEGKNENLKYVNRVLACLLLSVVFWMIKTLIIKVMASSFHVKAYFDRIQEALYNQYVIEALSGPPWVELKRLEEDESRFVKEVRNFQNAGATMPTDLKASDLKNARSADSAPHQTIGRSAKLSRAYSRKSEDGIPIASLNKMNHNNVSAWNMKRLMKMVRHGGLSTLDKQLMGSSHEDESAHQIRTEREAKAAARKIFQNVARRGNKYIYLVDLMRFMQEEEAVKTMSLFEGSESQRISKSALKNWLVNAFRDRRALALTLNDTKTAVKKVHKVVNILTGGLIIVSWIIILGITTIKLVFYATSQLLLVAFIFGNTCRTIFEAIIFLFIMHPYDVGDRCEIDGVPMVVEEMNILTTIFLRWDNQKILYPNSVLATKSIGNYYRSPDMGEEIEFCLHMGTPMEKIALVKQKITSYMENKKEHWYPEPLFVLKNVEELNMIKFVMWPNQTINFHNVVERWSRRGLLIEEMVKIFKEHDIQYRLLPRDINVTAMPGDTSSRIPQAWTTT